MTKQSEDRTAVLYNANCPVCSYEINHYADYSRTQALPITFDDLNDPKRLRRWNLDAETAARRLHVVQRGEVLAGVPAFIALWREMPRYQWLAKVVNARGIFRLSCWSYDYVLAPVIYRWHLRRMRRASAN